MEEGEEEADSAWPWQSMALLDLPHFTAAARGGRRASLVCPSRTRRRLQSTRSGGRAAGQEARRSGDGAGDLFRCKPLRFVGIFVGIPKWRTGEVDITDLRFVGIPECSALKMATALIPDGYLIH